MADFTTEDCENWLNDGEPISDDGRIFNGIVKQLLATMQREAKLREALKETWKVLEARRFIDPICAGHADLIKDLSCEYRNV